MKFMTKSARGSNAREVVDALRKEIGPFPVRALIFFVSTSYDTAEVARLLHQAYPDATTIGCTSYAELQNTIIQSGTLTAMAFSAEAVDTFEAIVVENMTTAANAVETAVHALETKLGKRLLDVDFHQHFGISLFDGRSPCIEHIMDRLGNVSDIVFVGGYASDDFTMSKIKVFCNGQAYEDAAVLAVVKPVGKFALLKTQSAESTGLSFIATKVDAPSRTILEFDNRPAAEVYAQGIGIRLDQLNDSHFLDYPLGLMAQGDPFIRAGRQVLDNGGLQLFCSVREGQRLYLMKTANIVEKTTAALEAKRQALGTIAAILDFDCAHRDLSLRAQESIDQYATLFQGTTAAGFATFGELYIANVNQTSVMALFA